MSRISRKQVEKICEVMSDDSYKYELIKHQQLENRPRYWYTYSIIVNVPKYTSIDFTTGKIETKSYQTGWKHKETLVNNVSLKEAYEYMMELLNNI